MKINLFDWQLALVLKALSKLPYEEVCETIADIKRQIMESDTA